MTESFEPVLQKVSSGKERTLLKRGAKTAGVIAAGLTISMAVAGNANADRIWVGGACDGNGDGLRGTAIAQGRWAAGDETAHYPASMAPVSCADVNNTNTIDSIRIGGQQVVDFYYRHQNDPWVDAEGFSLGAGVVNWASMKLAEQHGGNLPWNFHPVTVGDGWSEAGVLNHPLAVPSALITRPMGIPTNWELHPVPGTTVRNDANDFFGTTGVGPWNIPAQINRWVQSGAYGAHRDVNPFGEPYTVVERGGVRFEYYGPDQAFRAWEHMQGHIGGDGAFMPDGMLNEFLRNGAAMGNMPQAPARPAPSIVQSAMSLVPPSSKRPTHAPSIRETAPLTISAGTDVVDFAMQFI